MAPDALPQMTHMAIYVHDLNSMRKFYESVLGLVVSDEGRGMVFPADFVFFTSDPTKHHQFVLVTGRADSVPSTINQISFHVESLLQLKEIARRGRDAGSTSILPLNHGNALSVYIQDPEGNTIEVYADTPWYVHQPYSKPLDLSLPDDEIMRLTEAMVRAEPSFLTRDDWIRRTADRLRTSVEARNH